jgi:hypothetical protein
MNRTHLLAVAIGTGAVVLIGVSAEARGAEGEPAAEAAPAAPAPEQPVAMAAPAAPIAPPVTAVAPRKPAPNSVYAEGLGAGLAYSLNYERMVIDDLGVRVGFSYLSMSATAGSASASSSFLSFPITASYIGIRKGKHSLELGAGATLTRASGSGSSFGMTASGSGMSALGTAMVGYRIHPVDRAGFHFRIGLMALAGKGLGLDTSDPAAFGVLPWGYISMGAAF